MSERQLGPIVGATLLCRDIDEVSRAYERSLDYSVVESFILDSKQCRFWGTPKLVGNNCKLLAAADGNCWLRLVEDPDCIEDVPLKTHGWMALETNVGNVDKIRKMINTRQFEIIGEPAYLQVSDAIKAMQVIGPAKEVSYLTQVDGEVPPFELPMTSSISAGLFIPVLCTPSREKSLAFYESLNKAAGGLKFQTKVTVLNNAWGKDLEHQINVATLQLDGKCLFEIDEVVQAESVIENPQSLPSGIAMVSCVVKKIDQVAENLGVSVGQMDNLYYPLSKAILLKGPSGELIELIGD